METGAVTASPALLRIAVEENPIRTSFDLTNTSTTPLPITLSGTDGSPYGVTISPQYGLQRWMSIEPTAVILQPNQPTKITVTIHPDETMATGGHYGQVVAAFENTPSELSDIGVQGRLNVTVFATKAGGREALELSSMGFERTAWGWPQSVTLTFSNTGTTDVVPYGRLSITNYNDSIVVNAVINPDSQPVFPENSHAYTQTISSPSQYWPGVYTASLQYHAGDTIDQEVTQSILIIPPLFLLFGSIILLSLLGVVIHKRQKR